jgi:hypothetical protein
MIVLVLSTSFVSCARGVLQRPEAYPEGTAALVTVSRESTLVGGAASHIFMIDGQEVLALRAGDQYTIPVAPGVRTIGAKCSKGSPQVFTVQLEAGKAYFFRTGPSLRNCVTMLTGADLLPPIELKFEFATPADAEVWLSGESGLVRGTRRFQAHFERMVLISKDVWRLRALIKDAIVSPAGSELTFEGTVNGERLKARLEKDKTGRVRVKFEGVTFQDERELEEFLSGFPPERLEELMTKGSVAGRPIELRR